MPNHLTRLTTLEAKRKPARLIYSYREGVRGCSDWFIRLSPSDPAERHLTRDQAQAEADGAGASHIFWVTYRSPERGLE